MSVWYGLKKVFQVTGKVLYATGKFLYGLAIDITEKMENKKEEMHRKAERGDAKAAWLLAKMYHKSNPGLSEEYLMKAAKGGHPFAKQVLNGKRSFDD